MSGRSGVSVVVPFAGDQVAAAAMLEQVGRLALGDEDELLIADNSPAGDEVERALAQRGERVRSSVTVVRAAKMRSSYYARNAGAERARRPWVLFLDADCIPEPSLIDRYLADEPDPSVGAISGRVAGAPGSGLVEDWYASRRVLDQTDMYEKRQRPAAVTANLLVRRDAWEEVGGFLEGIRSGGDTDFCWRLQDRGWTLSHRPAAAVEHRHRTTVRELARQFVRFGAGLAWLNRRYPGSSERPRPVRSLLRCAAGIVAWTLTARLRRATYKAIDAVAISALTLGYLRSNADRESPPADVAVLVNTFPQLSETFVSREVDELVSLGARLRVEAITRPERPGARAGRSAPVAYVEDGGFAERLAALCWLTARHPLRSLQLLPDRWRWDPEDYVSLTALAPVARRLERAGVSHMHAHFATASSVSALRLSRLLGVPFSVATHGHDVWVRPRRLRAKLAPAAFVTTPCEYFLDRVREVLGDEGAARAHEVILGVDPQGFRRRRPYPGDRTVAAVGRLVEKKGFEFLIGALAELDGAVRRAVVIGDGPLRPKLERLAAELGVSERVEFLGAKDPDAVRELLETADVLAVPCVVGSDGDRDSMPIVAKEAMAMEVPVVASREVGLPEAVTDERGRLVPPGDSVALAGAIDEVLRMSPREREAMGSRGREWVLNNATLRLQAARMLALIEAARDA